jgi:sortase A
MTKKSRGMLLAGATSVFSIGALFFALAISAGPGPAEEPEGVAGRDQPAQAAPAAEPEAAPRTVPESVAPPKDKSLRLSVPAMARVEDVPVETAPGQAEGPLRRGVLHVAGTGFPWQSGANTYLAGHRLGFPGTASHLLFWDLDELRKGDEVLLRDALDRTYRYRVFRKMVVGPREVSVTEPVAGKSVVSLQTCTLPDYKKRLVVQAALVPGTRIPHRPSGDAFGLSGG